MRQTADGWKRLGSDPLIAIFEYSVGHDAELFAEVDTFLKQN